MRGPLLAACAAILLFASPLRAQSLPTAVDAAGKHDPNSGKVIVSLRAGADVSAVATRVGARVLRRSASGPWIFETEPERVAAAISALSADAAVDYAEPDHQAQALVLPDDTYYGGCPEPNCYAQWAWAKIQVPEAWDLSRGSPTVKVAVIDTGVDTFHPDLPPLVAQWDFVNGDASAEDDYGHGTHVAGTIGALTGNGIGVAGANWQVSLMAAKVLSADGYGSYIDIADAIRWAADNGAQVINLSLGSNAEDRSLQDAMTYAAGRGAVLTCAAGNSGNAVPVYPAAYRPCIAVAATDDQDRRATFASYGSKWVDVAAPGTAILSTFPDTPVTLHPSFPHLGYAAMNGSSMSSAHVAGLAALIWASGRCATADCVRKRIENNADRISGTGKDWSQGRINAWRSLSARR